MKTSNLQNSEKPKAFSYNYLYREFKNRLITHLDFKSVCEHNYLYKVGDDSAELVTYEDVLGYFKKDLLPYFESIFDFNIFNSFIKSNGFNDNKNLLFDALSEEFIQFIFEVSNQLIGKSLEFKSGSSGIYKLFSKPDFKKETLLFVFRNSKFTGNKEKYQLNISSNDFIKKYLNEVLIGIRQKPEAFSSRLTQLEINRIHIMILKNEGYNFLNWYLEELKSILVDMKFISKNKPNYGLNCTEKSILKLFNELVRYDFIDMIHTAAQDFRKVLLDDWFSHDSTCVLKMDNPQTKYFVSQFKVHVDSGLTLVNIEKAKNISNKSGYINSASLNASSSRNKIIGPKREQDLMNIFKALNG